MKHNDYVQEGSAYYVYLGHSLDAFVYFSNLRERDLSQILDIKDAREIVHAYNRMFQRHVQPQIKEMPLREPIEGVKRMMQYLLESIRGIITSGKITELIREL